MTKLDQISVGEGKLEKKRKEREKERRRRRREKLHLLSRLIGDRIVGSSRSKRQSWSTHRELCMGTKNTRFRQTPRGRGFSPTRFISCLRSIQMVETNFLLSKCRVLCVLLKVNNICSCKNHVVISHLRMGCLMM